jgi:hypothetical protein
MNKYRLTDDKGNIEILELLSSDNNVLKFKGHDSIINLRSFDDGSLRLFRESPQVRVSIVLLEGNITQMKIYDKSQNVYVDCSVKARTADMTNIEDICIEYDMLNGEEIADTISLRIGVKR